MNQEKYIAAWDRLEQAVVALEVAPEGEHDAALLEYLNAFRTVVEMAIVQGAASDCDMARLYALSAQF